MAYPLVDPLGHQRAVLTAGYAHQTPAATTPASTTIINSNNDWRHHTHHGNNDTFNGYNISQTTVGTNLGLQPIDPTGPCYRDPYPLPLPPLNSPHTIQVMPLQCLPLPDCTKPPPILFQYPPPGGFYPSPGQENDSLFSEGSSLASSKQREEGPSHWDQGSDSANGSTPLFEDQDPSWRTPYLTGVPPPFWYPPGPRTLPYPCGINQELLIAEPCREAQVEIEDWWDQGSVFDWDQYKLTEEEEEEMDGGKNRRDVEDDCKDIVDMEICSIASESNDEDNGSSRQRASQEENTFSQSDRLTDSQMLSLLRHLSATDKNNDTNKNICHTIELFLTLLPVQLERDRVEKRKASMSSAQMQIFEFLQSKAPWVVDEQILRSMDLLPFILKRILTSMELQHRARTLPTSTEQAPQKSKPSEKHTKTKQPHHRKRDLWGQRIWTVSEY